MGREEREKAGKNVLDGANLLRRGGPFTLEELLTLGKGLKVDIQLRGNPPSRRELADLIQIRLAEEAKKRAGVQFFF